MYWKRLAASIWQVTGRREDDWITMPRYPPSVTSKCVFGAPPTFAALANLWLPPQGNTADLNNQRLETTQLTRN